MFRQFVDKSRDFVKRTSVIGFYCIQAIAIGSCFKTHVAELVSVSFITSLLIIWENPA